MCFEHGDVFPPSAVLSVGHTTLSVEIWGDNLVRSTGVDKRRSSFPQDDEGKRISEVRFLQMVILRGAEVKESVTMQNRRCSHIGTESKQFRNLQGFNNTPSTDPWRCHQRTGPDTDQQPGTTGPSSTDGLNRSKHREEADTRVEGEQLQNGGTISYNARKYYISAAVQFAIPWSLSYIFGRCSETTTMAVLYSCVLSTDEYITPSLLPPPGLNPVNAMTWT